MRQFLHARCLATGKVFGVEKREHCISGAIKVWLVDAFDKCCGFLFEDEVEYV